MRKKIYKDGLARSAAWSKKHMKSYAVRLNQAEDADLIWKLESVPNKTDYIRGLIRADITKGKPIRGDYVWRNKEGRTLTLRQIDDDYLSAIIRFMSRGDGYLDNITPDIVKRLIDEADRRKISHDPEAYTLIIQKLSERKDEEDADRVLKETMRDENF